MVSSSELQDTPRIEPAEREMPDDLHPRHLMVRLAQVVAVIALVAVSISALPGLDALRDRLTAIDPAWIGLLVLAEVGSAAGYLLVFRSTFCPKMSWALAYDIALSELAANSLLPSGGAGGLALGVWALRQAGMSTGHIARRTVAFFVVTSAANFLALILVGIAMFVGLLTGTQSPLLTLVPAVITALGALLAGLSPRLLRALGVPRREPQRSDWRGRTGRALRGWLTVAADGVELAISLLRARSFGVVVGSLAYLAFDIAALGSAFAAVGHVPALGPLVLAYLIGQLGNLVPLPGGVGGTEGALVAVYAVYGVNISVAAAAVLTYRLFQLAIPALLGTPAFFVLRRKLMRLRRPELVCAPLGAPLVEARNRV